MPPHCVENDDEWRLALDDSDDYTSASASESEELDRQSEDCCALRHKTARKPQASRALKRSRRLPTCDGTRTTAAGGKSTISSTSTTTATTPLEFLVPPPSPPPVCPYACACASIRLDTPGGFAGDVSLFQRRRRDFELDQLQAMQQEQTQQQQQLRAGKTKSPPPAPAPPAKRSSPNQGTPRSLFPPIDTQQFFGDDALPLVPDFSIEDPKAADSSGQPGRRPSNN